MKLFSLSDGTSVLIHVKTSNGSYSFDAVSYGYRQDLKCVLVGLLDSPVSDLNQIKNIQTVDISCVNQYGKYVYFTNVQYELHANQVHLITDMEGVYGNRRRYPRHNLCQPCAFQLTNSAQPMQAQLLNVSRYGVAIHSQARLPEQGGIAITIKDKINNAVIHVKGQIVHMEKKPGGWECGVELDHNDDLVRMCHSLQNKQLEQDLQLANS